MENPNPHKNQPAPAFICNMMGYPNPQMNQPAPPTLTHNCMGHPNCNMNPNFFMSAVSGDIEVFKIYQQYLQQLVCDCDQTSKGTILHVHIKYSNMPSPKFVEEILTICPSLLTKVNDYGDSPLHFAAECGHSAIAAVLLRRARHLPQGSEKGNAVTKMLKMKNYSGKTAIDKAVENKKIDALKILIHQAQPSSLDFAHRFLDIIELTQAYKDQEIFNAITAKSHNGMTGLREALMKNDFQGTQSNNTFLHCYVGSNSPSTEFLKKILEICPISLLQKANAKGNTPLHIAAKRGHSAIVEVLINAAENGGRRDTTMMLIKMKNSKGKTAIDKAAKKVNVKVLEILIEKAEPGSLDFGDYFLTIICQIGASRDQEMMDAVILKSHNGITGLYEALMKVDVEDIEMVEKMLDMCPTLLLRVNARGNTLLHIATRHGHVDIVKALLQPRELENGERIDGKKLISMKNEKGETALDKASKKFKRRNEVLKILIKEADPELLCCADKFSRLLYVAARSEEGILDLIEEKIGNGAYFLKLLTETVIKVGELNGTLLHMSIYYNATTNRVKRILDLCPSLLLKINEKGDTAFHVAARSGKSATVEFLLKHAKDQSQELQIRMLKMENKDGNTALDLALKSDQMEAVKALIKEDDPDFWYFPDTFLKVLNLAAQKGDHEMLVAVAKGPNGLKLREALTDSDTLEMQPSKDTILHVHIKSSKQPSIKFVSKTLEICPSLLKTVNDKGDTPLHVASQCGHSDIVKVLLEIAKPQDQESEPRDDWEMLKMTNKEGDTALHKAVRHGRIDVAKILINADDPKSLFSPNKALETPLYLATALGYKDVVSEIFQKVHSGHHQGANEITATHAAFMNSNTPALWLKPSSISEEIVNRFEVIHIENTLDAEQLLSDENLIESGLISGSRKRTRPDPGSASEVPSFQPRRRRRKMPLSDENLIESGL